MDQTSEPSFLERARAWLSRRAAWIVFIIVVVGSWLINRYYYGGSWQSYAKQAGVSLWDWLTRNPQSTWSGLLLFAMTLFLAYANLYLKISVRAPNLQRRLSPRVFVNVPFVLYFGVYLTLAVLARVFFLRDVEPWYVAILGSALIGIGAANTDIRFGGFNVQPLAEFLRSLEAVVEAGIATLINELDVAKRSGLRDQLASLIDPADLERECLILGIVQADLDKLKALAGADRATYNGLLARELVKTSEANAWRLIDRARERSLLYRLRRRSR